MTLLQILLIHPLRIYIELLFLSITTLPVLLILDDSNALYKISNPNCIHFEYFGLKKAPRKILYAMSICFQHNNVQLFYKGVA